MVHITVIQACPLAHSLSGGRAGCPRGSCPAGWLGKQSLQKPSNPGQAAGEWRREMRRDISALQGSGRPERGVGSGQDGEGKAAFHPLSELLGEELLPQPCCLSLLEMLKEKQKGEGGRGLDGRFWIPGLNLCAPAGASHGSRWGRLCRGSMYGDRKEPQLLSASGGPPSRHPVLLWEGHPFYRVAGSRSVSH